MIEYKTGNLLDSTCECLVNTVNTVGVMGKGLALCFKTAFPEMFKAYQYECERNYIEAGTICVWRASESLIILNAATKGHWKNPSKYIWIWRILHDMNYYIEVYNIQSVAIPHLGCGNGGLDKSKVKRMIELAHELFWQKIKIELYE